MAEIPVIYASRQELVGRMIASSMQTSYNKLLGWDDADVSSPQNLLAFAKENMAATFDFYDDAMPDYRQKLIHARGSMAPVIFNITAPTKFTGLFQTGGDSCLARLSVAVNPSSGAFTPGMAIKCFRYKNPSGNIISMFSLDGQGDNWNFFQNEFSNIISEPKNQALKLLEKLVFNRASDCATWLSLRQWSVVDQEGNETANPVWPQQIFFVPGDIQFSDIKGHADFRDDLATIPNGSKLYDVFVADVKGGPRYKIGEVVTTGEFIASGLSDHLLFFQHDRGERDNCGKTKSLF